MQQKDIKVDRLSAFVAGAGAGTIEGLITYPFEFVKTNAQFVTKDKTKPPGLLSVAKTTYSNHGVIGFYKGVVPSVAGNALTLAIRFAVFDQLKSMMTDTEGKLTPTRTMFAGICAGMLEASLAQTPFDTVKTKLIEDQRRPNPRFKGLYHAVPRIISEEGISGIYRGVFPTMTRQAANSAVRFTAYGWLKNKFIIGDTSPPMWKTFLLGAAAGIVTVYATMPLDVIKTRIQTVYGRQKYQNAFKCLILTAKEDGITRLWSGATPRLGRLMLSGGIVFSTFEKLVSILGGRGV